MLIAIWAHQADRPRYRRCARPGQRQRQFALPKFWGSGSRVSADGTKWNLNLSSTFSQTIRFTAHFSHGRILHLAINLASPRNVALYKNTPSAEVGIESVERVRVRLFASLPRFL